MAKEAPLALILGHSFVRRLRHDLETSFDSRANISFNLLGTASVYMHGVGGRTVPNLRAFDLHEVKRLSPDIVILELGTNDLSYVGPEVVGSAIDDLVRLLLDSFFGACSRRLSCHATCYFRCVSTGFVSRACFNLELVHQGSFRGAF